MLHDCMYFIYKKLNYKQVLHVIFIVSMVAQPSSVSTQIKKKKAGFLFLPY